MSISYLELLRELKHPLLRKNRFAPLFFILLIIMLLFSVAFATAQEDTPEAVLSVYYFPSIK